MIRSLSHAGGGLRVSALALIVAALASMVRVEASADSERLQIGDALPPIQGEYLTGRPATLPAACAGRTALLLLGFTYASRVPVEAWGEWFRKTIGIGPGVTLFEVPMLGGVARLGRWFIDSGMRKGTPAGLHENVITVYSGTGDWKKRLGVSSAHENDAFLIVIDEDGIVRRLHHGPFDATRADELKEPLAGTAR